MRIRFIIAALSILLTVNMQARETPQINPTPQDVRLKEKSIVKPEKVRIIGENEADFQSVKLVKRLFEDSNDKRAFSIFIGKRGDKSIRSYHKQIPSKSEGYYLLIDENKIVIAGNDDRGTYYGVKTLEQLLRNENIPVLEIFDYPDITARGVVEGFYGTPWSFEDRMNQLKFYGDNKLNTYIYGPKDDPYHSSPHWRDPYPTDDAAKIKQLVNIANENHVDFVWAIHPGLDIKWTNDERDVLMKKLELMYELGVRAFAVFFDDISGEGVNAQKQAELLNYIDDNFIQSKKDIRSLILCPTEYNKSWSNIEKGYLPTLGKVLNKNIHIMWTGDRVISDIDVQGLNWINSHINRNAYIWWNFPVSDYVRDHLLLGPSYGLDTEAKGMMSGFMSNPMEHAEASKIAIYGVADYSWNIASYKPMKAWENALKSILPNNVEALRTFAIHNADLGPNGHGYRRDESWKFKDTAEKYLNAIKYKKLDTETTRNVRSEFSRIIFASNLLQNDTENKNFIDEITPWLKQFHLLGECGLTASYLQEAISNNDKSRFDMLFNNIKLLKQEMFEIDNTLNQNPYQPGVKTGSLVLEPLIDSVLVTLSQQYEEKYKIKLPLLNNYSPHLVFSNIDQVKHQPVRFLRKTVSISPLLEVVKMPAGSYFGIELVPEKSITQLKINIGTEINPDWAIVEVSENGENWQAVDGKTNSRGEWIANKIEGKYRYIRLRNHTENGQECFLRAFEIKTE